MEIETAELRAARATQRAQAYRMHLAGVPHDTIAETLGYTSTQDVHADIVYGLKRVIGDAYGDIETMRQAELARLDDLYRRAMEIANTDHDFLFQGYPTGVVDDGPKMVAIRTALRVMDRRAKLMGLDAPTRVVSTGMVRHELVGVDPEDLT